MRSIFLFFVIISSINSFGQNIYSTKEDLKNSKEIIFYGYDFSHFKLAEARRLNKNISVYIPTWIRILNDFNNEKYLEKKLKKNKVILDFGYTTSLIDSLKDENFVSISKHTIPPDSIQGIINKYSVKQKEGIGFVIVVECFEKETDVSTAYFIFFDISTKKIIMLKHFGIGGHAVGLGLSKYWGGSLKATIYYYLDEVFQKQLNAN